MVNWVVVVVKRVNDLSLYQDKETVRVGDLESIDTRSREDIRS